MARPDGRGLRARISACESLLTLIVSTASCGGTIAADPGRDPDASAIDEDSFHEDSSAAPSMDDADDACPASDPCFSSYLLALQNAVACMGHANKCSAYGGGDPSGCAVVMGPVLGATRCTWPSGGFVDLYPSGESLGHNAKGEFCFDLFTDGKGHMVARFPEGQFGTEVLDDVGTETLYCPSPSFPYAYLKSADAALDVKLGLTNAKACGFGAGLFCCSPSSPATCP